MHKNTKRSSTLKRNRANDQIRIKKPQKYHPVKRVLSDHPLLFFCFVYLIIIMIGRYFLAIEPFKHSTIHQMILTTISLLQIYMLFYLRRVTRTLMSITNGYNVYIHQLLSKLIRRINHTINYLWPIIPAVLFARKQIIMEYVPFSATGIYAVIFGASTFYIGLMCYGQLLLVMLTVRDIAKIKINDLPFDFPDDTLCPPEWLTVLYTLFKKGEYAFFSVGILYTLEYVLLMPENIITFDADSTTVLINVSNRIGFLTGWLFVIVLIIIAFPMHMSYFSYLFKKLVKNLKAKATNEMKGLFCDSTGTNLGSFQTMFKLNNEIMSDDNYLFKSKTVYPVVATVISIVINLIKITELLWPKVSLLFS